MDQGDLEQRLQVPTGSKRPSPSPSEGEEDREFKKFRAQPSNSNENEGFQSNELVFPFTDFPREDFFGNQLDPFWSNQDAHGMLSSTTDGFNLGYNGPYASFIASNTDNGTYLGDELATAMDVDIEAEADIWWRDLLQNPHQGSESFIDGQDPTGADCGEQSVGFTANSLAFPAQFQDPLLNEGEFSATTQDLPPEVGVLKRVESIPIRRAQVDERPSQKPAASFPKESTDVNMSCDTCFGVVGINLPPLHDLSDSSTGDSNSFVIVHPGWYDPSHSC